MLDARPPVGWDPYLDLEHGVLRNRLGITDRDELARAEAVLTATRLYELARAPIVGGYDLAHLQAIYRYVFSDVYEWAGQIRTVSIGMGRLFWLPQHLESLAGQVFDRLARGRSPARPGPCPVRGAGRRHVGGHQRLASVP